MVATRRQRADGINATDSTSKPAANLEGIKAPARRAARVKQPTAEPTTELPLETFKPANSTMTEHSAGRANTRSKRTTAKAATVEEPESKPAPPAEKTTVRRKATAPAKPKVEELKQVDAVEEKEPPATRNRKVVVTAMKQPNNTEAVIVHEEPVKETITRATRSTASARARQAPVAKETKTKAAKAKLPRSGPVTKPISMTKRATKREEVKQEDRLPDRIGVATSDQPRDESPESKGMMIDEIIDLETDEIAQFHFEPVCAEPPPEETQKQTKTDIEMVTAATPAKRKSGSRLPSPKKIKLDTGAPDQETFTVPVDEPQTSPLRSSSMIPSGACIGSPKRLSKTPRLMLTPAKNRFRDWTKRSGITGSPRDVRDIISGPVTPPPTFNPSSNNLSLLRTCPGRVLVPPPSCLRKTKPMQALPEVESPKKTVSFTVKTPISALKPVPAQNTDHDITLVLATPVVLPSLQMPKAAGEVETTPWAGGFLGSILRTPKIFTPWTSSKNKILSTPGTVHWTWNPVTPAFQPPALSPMKSGLESAESTDKQAGAIEVPATRTKDIILKGVRCYVEVRWQSGSDGSSMFASLLRDLGAEVTANFAADTTHVLWGNGNLATLERVQLSGGVVRAVNLNWPMDCEKEGRRLDEDPYLIDFRIYGIKTVQTPMTVARTPRALSTLDPNRTPTPVESTPCMTTAKRLKSSMMRSAKGSILIQTPAFKASVQPVLYPGQENLSMSTEGITLTPSPVREKLFQQTCPPKQSGRTLLFQESPVKGRVAMKRRLSQG